MTENAGGTPAGQLDPDQVAFTVHAVWIEVLEADGIAPATHFFDFGGHSIAAMRVMSRLRREWGVALPTRLIFDHPVLSDFTAAATDRLREAVR